MRNNMRAVSWFLFVFCTSGGVVACAPSVVVAADEPTENEGYTGWMKFRVGASASYNQRIVSGGRETVIRLTHTLVSLTSETALIETTSVVIIQGKEAPQTIRRQDIPRLRSALPENSKKKDQPPATKISEGEETLTVKGKEMSTKFVKMRLERDATEILSTVWTSPEVPGGLVKLDSRGQGQNDIRISIEFVGMTK